MQREAAFARSLQAFVDVSVDGGAWDSALTAAQDALGVRGVIIQGLESFAGHKSAVFQKSSGVPVESLEPYQSHFIHLDVRAQQRHILAHGALVFDHAIGELAQLDRSEIYAELFRPFDIGRFAAVELGAPPSGEGAARNVFLTVLRHNNSDAPDAALSTQIMLLVHVVRGALRSAAAFAALRAESDAKSVALDHAAFGCVLLGEGGRVIEANAAARAIFARREGLSCRSGRLAVHDTLIQGAIEDACRLGRKSAQQAFTLRRMAPAKPLALMLTPLGRDIGGWLAGGAGLAATLFVVDPDTHVANADGLWRSIFDLTAAESAVAALLVQGLSTDEIAKQRGVSRGTVQTQMKRIHQKVDASSQGQTVARLLKAAPFRS